MEDEARLTMRKDAGRGIDKAVSDTAARKIGAIAGRNSAEDIRTEDRGRGLPRQVFTGLCREILIRGLVLEPTTR